jgi:hypothetical protein
MARRRPPNCRGPVRYKRDLQRASRNSGHPAFDRRHNRIQPCRYALPHITPHLSLRHAPTISISPRNSPARLSSIRSSPFRIFPFRRCVFHPVPQRCGRFLCRRLLRSAFAFPLPPLLTVKCFREHVLATSVDINPHLAGPGGEVIALHFKLRIGNVKIELYRLDRFDSGATTHCYGVTLDHFVNRCWRATASKQRDCNYDCRG